MSQIACVNLDNNIPECKYFKWSEVLWLPRWKIHVVPRKEQRNNLMMIAKKLDWIRAYFSKPIYVTSGFRPEIYNQVIGGAPSSYHKKGLALYFVVEGLHANDVRKQLEPLLEHLGIRMEKLRNASWTHIDLGKPGITGRYFIP